MNAKTAKNLVFDIVSANYRDLMFAVDCDSSCVRDLVDVVVIGYGFDAVYFQAFPNYCVALVANYYRKSVILWKNSQYFYGCRLRVEHDF